MYLPAASRAHEDLVVVTRTAARALPHSEELVTVADGPCGARFPSPALRAVGDRFGFALVLIPRSLSVLEPVEAVTTAALPGLVLTCCALGTAAAHVDGARSCQGWCAAPGWCGLSLSPAPKRRLQGRGVAWSRGRVAALRRSRRRGSPASGGWSPLVSCALTKSSADRAAVVIWLEARGMTPGSPRHAGRDSA